MFVVYILLFALGIILYFIIENPFGYKDGSNRKINALNNKAFKLGYDHGLDNNLKEKKLFVEGLNSGKIREI